MRRFSCFVVNRFRGFSIWKGVFDKVNVKLVKILRATTNFYPPSKTWAGTATVWCYWVPVRYVGTSYTSVSARDGILSGRRAGAHRIDYVVTISKTIVNSRFSRLPCRCRPSIATQSVLMCPYETCIMTDHWKVGTMVWHCAGLIWTHISFKPRRRDGRATAVSRIVNSWWPCSL